MTVTPSVAVNAYRLSSSLGLQNELYLVLAQLLCSRKEKKSPHNTYYAALN